jgi:hypothetical protein
VVLVLTVDQGATLLPAVLCAGIDSALASLPCDLDPEQCLIRLHEEGETDLFASFGIWPQLSDGCEAVPSRWDGTCGASVPLGGDVASPPPSSGEGSLGSRLLE